ncbi:MAG: hypothetical protein H7201_05995 [Candidatus Saccharibacteria bacterium]|nr:hypothetical protein [Microbacteriaceae bacterium]
MSARRVWVVGGMAWDTVLHLDALPAPGGYARVRKRFERPGGTAANVAQAVASAGVETGFVSSLGNDERGALLLQTLEASHLAHLAISRYEGESEHVLVLVQDDGDRTIIGLAGGGEIHLASVSLDPSDIVVFVAWDQRFGHDLRLANDVGCTTIVGLGALGDPDVDSASIAFGSRSDAAPEVFPIEHLDRFERIVVTNAAEGATQYEATATLYQPAFGATVVDTTGAGDAFLAGYLALYAHGLTDGAAALEAGARWAAAMVSINASVPPDFATVDGASCLLDSA